MKRSGYLLLVLALVLGLSMIAVGCGDEESTATTAAAADTTGASTNTTDESTSTSAAPTSTTAGEVIKIKTACSSTETEGNGQIVQHFIDYIQEKSGGAIEIECYYGGSFATDPEIPSLVTNGDLGLSLTACVYLAMNSFPLGFSMAGYDSMQGTMDKVWAILDDPEVGPVIQAQAAKNNYTLIGYTAAGRSVLLSKTPVTSWADAVAQKLTLASPINLDLYASYGLSTVAIEPADLYEGLSRGLCDCIAFSAGGIESMKLYEVATNVGDVRQYTANQDIIVNLDLWNSLTDDQKTLFKEAAMDTSDWSISMNEELEKKLETKLTTELGGTWNTFSDEEGKDLNAKSMAGMVLFLNGFAEKLGAQAEQDILTAAWEKALNQTF